MIRINCHQAGKYSLAVCIGKSKDGFWSVASKQVNPIHNDKKADIDWNESEFSCISGRIGMGRQLLKSSISSNVNRML